MASHSAIDAEAAIPQAFRVSRRIAGRRINRTAPQSGQPNAEPLVLYSFRFRDPVSGKWVRARYVVERDVIAAAAIP